MPTPFFAPAILALIALTPAGQSPAPSAPPAAVKPRPAEVSFVLRLVRQATPGTPSLPATPPATTPAPPPATTTPLPPPIPLVLASPTLTTVDGQTTSQEIKGSDTTFFVSLSPTLEPADNANKSGVETANKATVRLFWSWRLTGKTLPGGVTAAELTGATRLIVDDPNNIVISRMSLSDPKTGVISEYRLEGRILLTDKTDKTATQPNTSVTPVTPTPAAP